MAVSRPTDLNFSDGKPPVQDFSALSAIAADAYRNDFDFTSLLKTSTAVPLEFGEGPILVGFYDSQKNFREGRTRDYPYNDDFDAYTKEADESERRMEVENEREMNEPLPLEYPVLTPEQQKVRDDLYPLLENFFSDGGFSGGNVEMLNKITAVLKKTENNGVIDPQVMDWINMKLSEKGLVGRISSYGGETYLGSLTQQSPDRYASLMLISRSNEPSQ